MTSDSSLVERQMADVELRPFTLDEFHRRRHRKQRNRRIAIALTGLALVVAAISGVLHTLGMDDEAVDTDIVGPMPSPFEGTWTSADRDGSSQTLEIRRTDGDVHEVVLRDDSAAPCSGTPSTETGSGQVRRVTELVTALALTCDDGRPPSGEALAHLTFVHDPATDELTDSIGVVWLPEGRSGAAALEGPSPFEGSWVVGRAGQYFPDSLEIRVIGDNDLHEVVTLKAETPQCAGGASTMRGTGRRESPVELAVVVDLTCDDGSPPVPQSPQEEGMLDDLGITFTHDPVTDELLGSLGSTFIRAGAGAATG
jgi:hypothetical protein